MARAGIIANTHPQPPNPQSPQPPTPTRPSQLLRRKISLEHQEQEHADVTIRQVRCYTLLNGLHWCAASASLLSKCLEDTRHGAPRSKERLARQSRPCTPFLSTRMFCRGTLQVLPGSQMVKLATCWDADSWRRRACVRCWLQNH